MSSVYDEAIAIDTTARTIWGEARNQGREGMEAVGSVIKTRVDNGCWWGKDFISVCRKPYQFSCWLDSDPNKLKLTSVTGADPTFVIALDVATRAVRGTLPDSVKGADSYFNPALAAPQWAAHALFCCKVGDHEFYRTRGS